MVDSTNLPEVDINQIATDLNNKMDRDGVNASCPTLLSRTSNSNGGVVEVWSDGYCVQTGHYDCGSLQTDITQTINLSKEYKDINFVITALSNRNNNVSTKINNQVFVIYRTINSFKCRCYGDGNIQYIDYRTEGYIR